MSPEDLLNKARLLFELWRTRRYDKLAAMGTLAGAAAFIAVTNGKSSALIPERFRPAVQILLAAFTLVCLTFLAVQVWRIRVPGASPAGQAVPSSVRGPLAFTEADSELFRKLGRELLINQALAYVTGNQFPVILVSGESGVGKTSLLRAGLMVPLTEQFDRKVIYWEATPTNSWESLTRTIIEGFGGDAGSVSFEGFFERKASATGVVMILDQFEQLSADNEKHLPIFELILRAARAPAPHSVTWMVAFRRDFVEIFEFWSKHGLSPPLVLVKAFTRDQAEEVMVALADKAGVRFERQLLKDFTASAVQDGGVSSVDIGIGTLVLVNLANRTNKSTITLADYKFAGGSSGVLTAYVKDRLSVYPNAWQEQILKALTSLIDLGKNTRIAEGKSAVRLASGSSLPSFHLAGILDGLAKPDVRILERLELPAAGGVVFRLPHERFIQPILTLAGPLLAKENFASVTLETEFTAWTRSKNPDRLLSGRDLKQVQNLLKHHPEVVSSEMTDYVRRSGRREDRRIIFRVTAIVLAIVVVAAISLQSVNPSTALHPRNSDFTPYGYTLSLLLFIVPILVITMWFLPRETVRISKKAFFQTIASLFPFGVILIFFFSRSFFVFPNPRSTLGIQAPAWGGPVPIEEYLFYFLGFVAVLLIYIWVDEYWLAAYSVPIGAVERHTFDRLLHFHWKSIAAGVLLVLGAVLCRHFFVAEPGFPGYFAFWVCAALGTSAVLAISAQPVTNWRAFVVTFVLIFLVNLLWESTIELPSGSWGFRSNQMIGIYIAAWNGVPIEELCA